MSTVAKSFVAVLAVLFMLPTTAAYVLGMGMLIKLSFSANASVYFVIALLLLPGWGLYALWRLLFNLLTNPGHDQATKAQDEQEQNTESESQPSQPFPAYLWVAIIVGALIAVLLCSPFISNGLEHTEALIFYGGPLVTLPLLLFLYVTRNRKRDP